MRLLCGGKITDCVRWWSYFMEEDELKEVMLLKDVKCETTDRIEILKGRLWIMDGTITVYDLGLDCVLGLMESMSCELSRGR